VHLVQDFPRGYGSECGGEGLGSGSGSDSDLTASSDERCERLLAFRPRGGVNCTLDGW